MVAEAEASASLGPIIVVEPDRAMRRRIRTALWRAGLRLSIRTAASGREALPHLARQRPALVVLASVLPGIDPAVLAAIVRSAYGDEVPILMLGRTHRGLNRARAISPRAFVATPDGLTQLTVVVRDLLGGKRT
jgi:DNA-binding response OmpR family regulator